MSRALEMQSLAGEPKSNVTLSPLAGKPAPKEMREDVARLESEYFARRPDLGDGTQLVSFGTSGHRGPSFHGTFTEAHVLAITQAICDYRHGQGTDGPFHIGKDTHALSTPAQRTAIEVLAANNVQTLIQQEDGVTRRERMVCRPAIGYGERLQDLCGELQGPVPPRRTFERGAGNRE